MLSATLSMLSLSALVNVATAAGPQTEGVVIRRSPVDYTAWNLEPGEVRIGPTDLDIGVARGVQVGTDPLLDAVGVYNARVRIGRRVGRIASAALDLGAHNLELGEFTARNAKVGLRTSVQAGPVGMHLGATASWFKTEGHPDLTAAAPLVNAILGEEKLAEAQLVVDEAQLDLGTDSRSLGLRAAVDLRLGGPHSLVLQAGEVVYRQIELSSQPQALVGGLPDDSSLDSAVSEGSGGATWGSLAWQYSGRNLQLRIGAGLSDIPYAWILPTTELSWRFGGPRKKRIAAQQS